VRYRVTRNEEVRFDLAAILDLVGNYVGYTIGKQKVAEINRTISKLADFPHIGSPRNDIVPGLRALPSAEKGVICFTVDEEARTVRIICVTYAGQDWQAIAGQRSEP
jgi:toxin ParE1/3/4